MPKGRLLAETASLLQKADWGLSTYHKGMPSYRPKSRRFPSLLAKVFHEKDIPIQVAVGNYDLGICGLDWIEELLVKYPSSALVKIRNLGYGEGAICVVAGRSSGLATVDDIQANQDTIRVAGEYPNLAESFALRNRLRRFSIFPLWGAAEVYPPENADLALIPGNVDEEMLNHDLVPISDLLTYNAYLIANKSSWERRDLSQIIASIEGGLSAIEKQSLAESEVSATEKAGRYPTRQEKESSISAGTGFQAATEDTVRLALPDGHQQDPTIQLLNKAGIRVDDYPSTVGNRRPTTTTRGVVIKVVRPQDMPLQVANSNFDLAITGRDWLREHLYQFPSSPVTELLDLKYSKVRVVAVVSKELPVEDVYSLRQLNSERTAPIRVTSEYVNIADKYARDNHLGVYRVIPSWGASEAFLPEDADLLIENTETGRTIARHNLKIIDTLCESTACLIGNKDSISSSTKGERIEFITETLRAAVE